MARIRIKLRTSTVPGKSGTVFYQVAHKKEVKQITTRTHLLPEEWDMEQLDFMIKEVNEREVKDDEILSDHAYLYDVKEKRFYF